MLWLAVRAVNARRHYFAKRNEWKCERRGGKVVAGTLVDLSENAAALP
jgi:frataxin-like iron-binding protein CyaY